MSIVSIVAREILDSRGNPTVEVDLRTEKGDHAHTHHVRTEHPTCTNLPVTSILSEEEQTAMSKQA